jgi:hypothetical protein
MYTRLEKLTDHQGTPQQDFDNCDLLIINPTIIGTS